MIRKKIIRAVLDMSDLIIAVSPEWAAVFKKISKTRVIVIFNFIDLPEKNYFNKDSIFITTTGQIEKRKGYYDIVKVIPVIVKDNENIRFRFCGNGEVKEISNEVNKKGISDYVLVSGWLHHSEVLELLKDTMIFLLPSYNEGMPLAILEAMSYGIPIISTNVGGIPTLVEHGVNGFLITPGDTTELEKSLRLLIDDSDLKIRISDNNYNKIKKQYSIEHNMMKIYKIYLELNE